MRVVDAGGFAAAARKLNMAPSTVTSHVQSLEERLGVRLLVVQIVVETLVQIFDY